MHVVIMYELCMCMCVCVCVCMCMCVYVYVHYDSAVVLQIPHASDACCDHVWAMHVYVCMCMCMCMCMCVHFDKEPSDSETTHIRMASTQFPSPAFLAIINSCFTACTLEKKNMHWVVYQSFPGMKLKRQHGVGTHARMIQSLNVAKSTSFVRQNQLRHVQGVHMQQSLKSRDSCHSLRLLGWNNHQIFSILHTEETRGTSLGERQCSSCDVSLPCSGPRW